MTPRELKKLSRTLRQAIGASGVLEHASAEQSEVILASARRLTSGDLKDRNKGAQGGASAAEEWQVEAWDSLYQVGEQRFIANTLAGQMSRAALYVGKIDLAGSPGTKPVDTGDPKFQRILNAIGDGPGGLGQILHRASINLFVAGEGWLVGIPPRLVQGTAAYIADQAKKKDGPQTIARTDDPVEHADDDVLSLTWRMLSVSEVDVDSSALATIKLETGQVLIAPVDTLYMVRLWRPDPQRAWEADSSTRSSLPVLRELIGLTMHVGAQIDSRLGGAGMLLFPTSADEALKASLNQPVDSKGSPVTEAMIEAMSTAIEDRSSASALVPIVVTMPDDSIQKAKYLTFSTPLDKETPKLRDESIRRLALGQDAPPELLLGTSGMNHWGAWLVREEVVTTHLEPPLALVCDALTTQYLRPVLVSMGFTPEDAEQYVVWYDVDHLIERPNRGADAKDLHSVGAITDRALREATGFEEGDAPAQAEEAAEAFSPLVQLVVDFAARAPSLVQAVGMPGIFNQLKELIALAAADDTAVPPVALEGEAIIEGESGAQPIPDTLGDPPPAGTPGNPDGNAA